MRISCSTSCLAGWPLPDALAVIRDAGYLAVDLTWGHAAAYVTDDGRDASVVQSMLDAQGLVVSGLRVADISAITEDDLEVQLKAIAEQMRVAKELGLSCVGTGAGDRRRQPMGVLIAGIRRLAAAATELNLNIELANAYGSRLEQLDDLRAVFPELDSPCLQLLNDAGEFHRASVNPRDAIAEFQYRLGRLVVSDYVGDRAVPLGAGEMNVPAIVQHARRIGYTGWLVVGTKVTDRIASVRQLRDARAYLEVLLG